MFPRIGTWGHFQGQQKDEVGEDVTAIRPRVLRNTTFTPKGTSDPAQEAVLGAHVGKKTFGWIRSEMAMRTLPKSMECISSLSGARSHNQQPHLLLAHGKPIKFRNLDVHWIHIIKDVGEPSTQVDSGGSDDGGVGAHLHNPPPMPLNTFPQGTHDDRKDVGTLDQSAHGTERQHHDQRAHYKMIRHRRDALRER